MHQQTKISNQIVFYDGDCLLCSRTVRFLINADTSNKFKFAPLGGTTAQQLEIEEKLSGTATVVLYAYGKIYTRSTAVLNIFRQLPFPWKILYILIVVPNIIRDAVYGLISKNRYKWFGKTDGCSNLQNQHQGKILV